MLLPSWCPLIASRLPEPTDNPRAVSSRRSSALRFPVPLSHRSPAAAPRRSLPFALARRAPLYSSRSTWPSFPLSAGKAPPSNWHSDVPAPEHAARLGAGEGRPRRAAGSLAGSLPSEGRSSGNRPPALRKAFPPCPQSPAGSDPLGAGLRGRGYCPP